MRAPTLWIQMGLMLLAGATGMRADDSTKAATIERLLAVTHAQALIAKSQEQVEAMMHQMLVRSTPTLDGTPKLKQLEALIQDEVSTATKWESLKPDFVKVYATTFSEDELNGLVKFYETPLGQTIVDKMPVVQEQIMKMTQERIQARLPEMQKKMQELMETSPNNGKPDAGH